MAGQFNKAECCKYYVEQFGIIAMYTHQTLWNKDASVLSMRVGETVSRDALRFLSLSFFCLPPFSHTRAAAVVCSFIRSFKVRLQYRQHSSFTLSSASQSQSKQKATKMQFDRRWMEMHGC